jgi:hypothetical protein
VEPRRPDSIRLALAFALVTLVACDGGDGGDGSGSAEARTRSGEGTDTSVPAPPAADPAPDASGDPCGELRARIAELELELAAEQGERLEREREWLRFTQTLGSLELPLPDTARFESEVPAEPAVAAPQPAPVDEAKLRRATEIARSLRALLAIEGVRGVDLLEAGQLGDGWIGPVVFRLVDERGRLAGSLSAERLRLQGSRAARTVTVVLERGYEMRGGERTPFAPGPGEAAAEGGVRRIELGDSDPGDWVEAVPELFGAAALEPANDDGKWSLVYVEGALNRLLRADVATGYFRFKHVGGVVDRVLRDVRLEQLTADGKLERRLFADRCRVELQDRGVALILEDGAQMRGAEKTPFLDGRFRIFLPRAVHADWTAAEVPLFGPAGAR